MFSLRHTSNMAAGSSSSSSLMLVVLMMMLVVHVKGDVIPDQSWGYITVRPSAHTFYWLYGAQNQSRDSLPLIMWLQGGPGASSTGFGNFEEIGPLDVYQSPRNSTWVQAANVLFVDNPVGTGYSYVDDLSALTTNNTQIAMDLLSFFEQFLARFPVFSSLPFYIFSESYGGKMATGFAYALNQAIQAGQIKSNFRGVSLGDSWIDGLGYTECWADFLKATSIVSWAGQQQISAAADKCRAAFDAGNYLQATAEWGNTEDVVVNVSDDVSFYNILVHNDDGDLVSSSSSSSSRMLARLNPFEPLYNSRKRHLLRYATDPLDALMNGPIKSHLGIIPANVTWGGQSNDVFSSLSSDFMLPVYDQVLQLIQAGVNVTVVNGQLDLICATPGTEGWIAKMDWPDYMAWQNATRTPIYAVPTSNNTDAFVQSFENFKFIWVMRAGHMIPADNPPMGLEVLRIVTAN